jgi:hypothetical protein
MLGTAGSWRNRFGSCVICAMLACAGLARAEGIASGPGSSRQMALSVSPGLIEMKVPPGRRQSASVTFANLGRVELRGFVRLMDFVLDEEGRPDFTEPGTQACSARSWVLFEDKPAVLKPGDTLTVQASMEAPRGASGGGYGAIVFDADSPEVHGIDINVRVGAASLLLLSSGIPVQPAGRVDDVAVKDGSMQALLRNTGKTLFHAAGRITLWKAGRLLATVKVESGTGTVLPGGVRRFTGKIPPRIEPGPVQAKVRFELDRGASTGKEVGLTIETRKPPGSALPAENSARPIQL